MNCKIICDSGASLSEIKNCKYESIPLKVITQDKEYIDKKDINIEDILDEIEISKQKSSTSCPNVNDYLKAFDNDGEKNIFVVTLTSALSGSYNAAVTAAKMMEDSDKNIHIVNSLSAGPKMQLIAEKLFELSKANLDFSEICKKIEKYKENVHLLFNIKNLTNLANNGRISQNTAKFAGLIGISLIGTSDEEGKISCIDKSRGDKKAMKKILKNMENLGYKNGKIKILHCFNEEAANYLKDIILEKYSPLSLEIDKTSLICSYYGQKGTVMIGFESGDIND